MNAVTPDYFATLGTRILRGRAITAADNASTRPVVMVEWRRPQLIAGIPGGRPFVSPLVVVRGRRGLVFWNLLLVPARPKSRTGSQPFKGHTFNDKTRHLPVFVPIESILPEPGTYERIRGSWRETQLDERVFDFELGVLRCNRIDGFKLRAIIKPGI